MAMYSVTEKGTLLPIEGEDPLLPRIDQLMGSMSRPQIEEIANKLGACLTQHHRCSSKRLRTVLENGNPDLVLGAVVEFVRKEASTHPQFRQWEHNCRTALEVAMAGL